ncbi:MAG: methyltransferase domain-containing protein [Patescibacteria group bacterium]
MTNLEIVWCPTCRVDLVFDDRGASCPSCRASYPAIGDGLCFVTLQSAHPAEDRPDSILIGIKNFFKRSAWFYNVLIRIFGASNGGYSPKKFLGKYSAPGHVTLNLGAGTQDKLAGTMNVDMFAFPGVDIIADIRHLPFKDGSVDETMCVTVLEHIDEPNAVLQEMSRVTKPGGTCFVTVPFIYPFHSSPNDYYRWTLEGLRLVAARAGFEEVASGLRHGPTAALFMILIYWIAIPLSFGSKRLHEVMVLVGMTLLTPFAHVFDLLFNRMAVSDDIALGFYFIGRKRS